MFYIPKSLSKPREMIYSFRIIVCRLSEVNPFTNPEITLIQACSSIKVPILGLMVRAWDPALILGHLLRIHLQSSVGTIFVLIVPWYLSHQIDELLPSYLAGGLSRLWNSAQASDLCLMKFLSQDFHPNPNVFPFYFRRGDSSNICISYRSGDGFYLAFLRTTFEMGLRVPLPNVQLLLAKVEGICGSRMSEQQKPVSLKRFQCEKLCFCEVCRQVAED